LLEAKDSSLAEILEGPDALTVRFEVPADAHHRGGLSLYGRSLGANSLDPTIVFTSI